jgi:hypothetical protein
MDLWDRTLIGRMDLWDRTLIALIELIYADLF